MRWIVLTISLGVAIITEGCKESLENQISTIEWSNHDCINWQDYYSRDSSLTEFDAYSHTVLVVNYDSTEEPLVVTVSSLFVCDSSYVSSLHESAQLLEHERLHFDITEIAARELRAIVLSHSNRKWMSQHMRGSFDSIYNELRIRQNLYDSETNHGTIPAEQENWKLRTDSLLQRYAQYRESEILIEGKCRLYQLRVPPFEGLTFEGLFFYSSITNPHS